jgi:hypothetical protein
LLDLVQYRLVNIYGVTSPVRNLKKRDHLGDPGVDGRIILRWIFRNWDDGLWFGSSWVKLGAGGRLL